MSFDLFGSRLEINIDKTPIESITGTGSNFVESVTIKMGLLHLYEVQVVLNPTFAEAIKLLGSGLMGLGMNVEENTGQSSLQGAFLSAFGLSKSAESKFTLRKINIKMHYGGKSGGWYSAILLAPNVKIGADGIQITLNGVGFFFKSAKIENTGERKGNLRDIVRSLLTEDNPDVSVDFEKSADRLLDKKHAFTQYKSNLETVREILHDNECILKVIPSGKEDHNDYQILSTSAARSSSGVKLVMYGQIDPTANIYPILDMECPTTNLQLPNGPWANFINKHDQLKKKVLSKVNPFDDVNKAAQAISAISPDGSMGGGSLSESYKGTENNIDARQAETLEKLYKFYVSRVFEYNITTVGIVDLTPGQLLTVQVGEGSNIVQALSGEYDINEVTHVFSVNGIETQLHLFRTGGLASKASGQAVDFLTNILNGNFNIQIPEELEDLLGGFF